MRRTTFLRWCLVNVVFLTALVYAKLNYHANIHLVAWLAVSAVLLNYAIGSFYAGKLAWSTTSPPERKDGLRHLERATSYSPKMAMLGTVAGFIIAFDGDLTDVSSRVRGASTGLIATFVGIACMLVLEFLSHILEGSDEEA